MQAVASSDREAPTSPVVLRDGLTVLPLSTVLTEVGPEQRLEHAVLVNTGPPYGLLETLDGVIRRTRGAPGDVAVVPAGAALSVRSFDGSPQNVESLVVTISADLLDEVFEAAGVEPARHRLRPAVGSRSPTVAQLAGLLRGALPDRSDLGRLALESLGYAFAVAVVQEHSTVMPRPERTAAPSGLSDTQVARVLRHVEDSLDSRLTLAELAAVAHVSPYHFARQFRVAAGTSPHRYVVQRRVTRAQELLERTRLPLPEVARRCGFADQSHLTRQLRQHLGATPAAVRAAAAGR